MNKAGQYISVLSGDAAYKAYRPNPLPQALDMDGELILLLTRAHSLLSKLDTTSKLIPNVDLFLGAYVRKEALLSSQIEGTQATLEDVLSADVDASVNLEVTDVVNYVNALNYAIERMTALPLCNRLLCETHAVLLQNTRGQDKSPGEFRRSQNWIGGANSTIQTTRYVPPTVEDTIQAMSDLEKFINESDMDAVLKTALAHYQFETIHPFLDGNGRIGRMLIILMLMNENILTRPVLYPSLFLKTNRIEYYDRLSDVRVKGNYEQWIKFYLTGVIQTCTDSLNMIEAINGLLIADEKKITHEKKTVRLVYQYLKEHPIINIPNTAKSLKMAYNTAASAISRLTGVNILHEKTSKARDRVFEYTEYTAILKSGVDN